MDYSPSSTAYDQITDHPILHEQIIDELAVKHGLPHLELLDIKLSTRNKTLTQKPAEIYIEKKIKEVRRVQDEIAIQRTLDVRQKRLQIRAF